MGAGVSSTALMYAILVKCFHNKVLFMKRLLNFQETLIEIKSFQRNESFPSGRLGGMVVTAGWVQVLVPLLQAGLDSGRNTQRSKHDCDFIISARGQKKHVSIKIVPAPALHLQNLEEQGYIYKIK
ncbi:hypothetical protein AAFF_G00036960 [Aldrovandia affinis]|uniref:Uncharacterized protein n=1 Tax=Aldrovandia affinis TaxID=143900 RepID=A0AAD7X036_9TELE|nr:hypothetical protein AAFF_G00036960 [Aldrovandia affinis]